MAHAGQKQNAAVAASGMGILPEVFTDRLKDQCDNVAQELRDEREFTEWHADIAEHMREHIKKTHAEKTMAQKDAMMKQMRQMLWGAWAASRASLRAKPEPTPYVDPRTGWAKHKGGNGPSTATNDHDSRPSEGVSAEEMPADDNLQ